MRFARGGVAAAALGTMALMGGCGEEEGSEAATTQSTASAAGAAKKSTKVTLRDSRYGKVLFDGKGGALYLFTSDAQGKSNCDGDCAAEWPPFYARGKLRPGPGVNRKLLGKTIRSDGRKQVTYAGHPLYYWVDDPRNQILCHNVTEFGGDWLVVRPSGQPAA
jgi:predicted lipoprotein with Yx(FWY)xxD motif